MHGREVFASPTFRDGGVRKYEVLRRLASGGMGTVFLGRLLGAHGFSRHVALKSMHAQYALDPNFAAMFVDEARLTALLHHPNIVPTLDVIADGPELTLVMEYVDGWSLWELFERTVATRGAFPLQIACTIIHDVLMGLNHAHEATDTDGVPLGIVHRDVSPQNVIVGRDGFARVLDFGIAKARGSMHATHTGTIRGKVSYMPPEQLRGARLDRRVDVYAAGVVLWEILTTTRLFRGEHLALVSTILNGEAPAPSSVRDEIGPELDAVVLRALAKDPNERFATAAAMANALASAVPLATRSAIGNWLVHEATLASADASPRATNVPSTTHGLVSGSRSRVDTLAPIESQGAPSGRSRARWAYSVIGLAMVGALGVLVGAQSGMAAARDVRVATNHSFVTAPPIAPPPRATALPSADTAQSGPPSVPTQHEAAASTLARRAPKGKNSRSPHFAGSVRLKHAFDSTLGF